MAKPEWGTKRVCTACATHFYDLKKSPAVCPKCGHEMNPEETWKTKHNYRTALAKKAQKSAVEEIEIESGVDEPLFDDEPEDDLSLLEDTSDLGGEGSDISEVFEGIPGGKEE